MGSSAPDSAGKDRSGPVQPWWETVVLGDLDEATVRNALAWSSVLTNVLMLCPGDSVDGVKVDSVRFAESRQSPGSVLMIVEGVKGKKRFASYDVATTAPECCWSWQTRKREGRLSWRELAPRGDTSPATGSPAAPPPFQPPTGS